MIACLRKKKKIKRRKITCMTFNRNRKASKVKALSAAPLSFLFLLLLKVFTKIRSNFTLTYCI